jgi:protein-S-isoprenylcysteine O-methyltransferase Ste14
MKNFTVPATGEVSENNKIITDNLKKDSAGVQIPPPLIFVGFGIAGIGINTLFPLSIGIPSSLTFIGLIVIAITLVFIMGIARLFKREETSLSPWDTTHRIISRGPYKYSRNPIYISFCGVLIGLAILFDTYWEILAIIPALIMIYRTVIVKEEAYLENKFGAEYLNYKSKVRRWL